MSIDTIPDSSSAFLRARAQRKLRPSLGLADIEQASPISTNDNALGRRVSELAALAPWRAAAVLLPIIDRPSGLSVLLTLRASNLRAHSGQVAFPGGKIEARETPHDAALRETQEEIGLEARLIEPLGWLDPFFTGTGFCVAPLVALIEPSFALTLNKLEVEEVFETPFAFLMDTTNHRLEDREWEGQQHRYYAMPHEGRYIWGATAGILRNLYEKLYS